MREPVRRCVGCGRRAPQRELVRFAARGGALVPGRTEPGRGAYTCRELACFRRAVERHAFPRMLRRSVRVDPGLARLYTDAGRVDGVAGDPRRNEPGEVHG